jgi:hypothetical protein
MKCKWVIMRKRNGVKAKVGIMKHRAEIGMNFLGYLKIKLCGEVNFELPQKAG